MAKYLIILKCIDINYIKISVQTSEQLWCTCGSDHNRYFFFFWGSGPQWARASSSMKFLDHFQRRTTFGRTPLDEWSARRRVYLTTPNTHNRQTSMSPVRSEPTISAGERPQTYALDRAATGPGPFTISSTKFILPVPVAARSKVWVCRRSLAGIVGSNPAGGMDVCLLWVLCDVR
jgi:hypothetical protein